MLDRYVDQVRLLVGVLPDIAAEDVFALKGGTTIAELQEVASAPPA